MLEPRNPACARCGRLPRPGARFCDACGAALLPATAQAAAVDLGSELKYVTVLFADMVGSTAMIADRSPEDARALLAPFVSAMVEAVQAFGGTLNRTLGDGVLAIFGAPHALEDHALRACHAAGAIHAAVPAGSPVRLRVGLASGLTLLGLAETDVGGAYPAFGATIHLAARLQALARPGTTLCSAVTRRLAGPDVEATPLGPHALAGFGGELEVFAVQGVRQAGPRFAQSAGRPRSPYVGREREMAALTRHAGAVKAGAAASVAVTGEAGLGKSRLVWEFARPLAGEGWRVLRAEAVSYGRDVPYRLVGTLLRAVFGLDLQAAPDKAAARLRRIAGGLGLAGQSPPALLSLLGLPLGAEQAEWDVLPPLRRREAIRAAVASLIGAVAQGRPTLVLLEDLHWADEESLRLLDLRPAPGTRLMLLATHRPEFSGWPATEIIPLQPLSPHSMERLILGAFPAMVSPALRRALVERANGNPFFLEELARDTSPDETGQDARADQVPPTIQGVLAAKIDRLDAGHRQAVFAAAALGNRFATALLRAFLHDWTDAAFAAAVSALCAGGLFQPADEPGAELGFAHALIQEVAYTRLPRLQRRDVHARIVEAIRRLPADRLADRAETLVYHAASGEAWEDLLQAAPEAGRRAAERSAYTEAARFFRQGILACGRLPRTDEVMAQEIDLRFELRSALFPTAGIRGSLENSTEAERLARLLGDKLRLAWATAYYARDLQLVGRPLAALEAAERAVQLAGAERGLRLTAGYSLAQACYARGDYPRTAATLAPLVAEIDAEAPEIRAGTPGPSAVFFRQWLVWSLARMGRHAEAEAVAVEMRALADRADHPLSRTLSFLSLGFALAFAGRLAGAEAALRRSLALCEEWDFYPWSTNILSCLGHVLARQGTVADGGAMLDEAARRTRAMGVLVSHANELAWLAEAHLLAGQAGPAAQQAAEAAAVARTHEERGNEALALVIRGEALRAAGDEAAALAALEQGRTLADSCGMADLVARAAAVLLEHVT